MKRLLFLLIVAALTSCGSTSSDSSSDTSTSSDDVILNAKIFKSDTQLILENNDAFDWSNVEVTLNDDWSYKTSIIKSNSKLNIGLLLFTKSDGEKFNPFKYAPKHITISCKADGKIGFTSADF